ncbi:hypothetical protein [Pseudomonas sp. zfem003]|uniref:hypothetical protein n=1 Tax=Pseudomonas sp. zfem003 TaxID=3078198 RepID=UPI002927D585|nr:hypothetical protein [Pseudomonas sp. zfem003]MDU9398031.1 hypothetical protein [Pseudomonas sp. zfem003]
MRNFSLDLAEFCEKAKVNAEQVVRKVGIDLLSAVVDRSPVGNPELWAANAIATEYNNEVARYNAELRSDPANLTRSGRLKRGLAVNDSMPLTSGAGYVGGRFRGNWQVSFEVPARGETGVIDANGSTTKSAGAAVIQQFNLGVGSIYLMNNVPYAQRLENGWSQQAPNGMVRITVVEFQAMVRRAVQALT